MSREAKPTKRRVMNARAASASRPTEARPKAKPESALELAGKSRSAAHKRHPSTEWRAQLSDLAGRIREMAAQLGPKLPPRYRSDQLLVSIEADTVEAGSERHAMRVVQALESPFAQLERDGLIDEVTAVGTRRIGAPRRGARRATDGTEVSQALAESVVNADDALKGVNLVRLAPNATLEEVRARLSDNPAIRDIERVPRRSISPLRRRSATTTSSWNLDVIAWTAAKGSAPDVKVAILDTGVDVGHPALPKQITYEHGGTSSDDLVGHGTHVAGIVAGRRVARAKFAGGVCNSDLYVWKVFGDEYDEEYEDYLVDEKLYLRALVAAERAGCRVVNLSIGGEALSRQEQRLIKRLVDNDVVVVAAMGNEYELGNPTEYPAAFDGVIAVGAVGPGQTRASFSNTGRHIAVVAPGEEIYSCVPRTAAAHRSETSYATWSGTSMAAPHVTGAVAAVRQAMPTLTALEVREALMGRAKALPAMAGRPFTPAYGAGLLQL